MKRDDKVPTDRKFSYLGQKAEVFRKLNNDLSYRDDAHAQSFNMVEYRNTSLE
jgi:hypothetical protein